MSNRFKSSQMCGTIENIDYPDGSVQAHAKFNRDIEILGDVSLGYEIYDISSNSYIDTGGNLKYKINNVNYTISPTQMIQLVNTLVSTTYLTDVLTAYAVLNSPHFVGLPTTTQPNIDDNSTQISTTAFVKNQNYATIYDLSNAFSQLDLSQYATNTNLTTSIENLHIDQYSKITDVSATIFNLNINQYATNTALNNAITNLHIENYITYDDISGQLVNLNLSQYAKTIDLNNAINNLNISNYTTFNDVSGIVFNYAKKSDLATEISNLNISNYATVSYVTSQISNLVNSAPESLNTLSELSSALGGDPNFSTTVLNLIGTKTTLYEVQSSTLSVSGLVTYNTLPQSFQTPTLNNQLVTKNYTDNNFLTLTNANNYLLKTDGATTYLTISNGAYTYLTKSSASSTYLPISTASTTYLTQSNASINYLYRSDASANFLSKNDASIIYLNKTDASTTYLSQATASSTYLTQANASINYLYRTDASNNFLSKNDASIIYLPKTNPTGTGTLRIDHASNGGYLDIKPGYNYFTTSDNASYISFIGAGTPYDNFIIAGNLYIGNSLYSTNGFLEMGNGNDLSRVKRNLNVDNVLRVGYNDATDAGASLSNNANVDVNGKVNATDYLIGGTSIFNLDNSFGGSNGFFKIYCGNLDIFNGANNANLYSSLTTGDLNLCDTISGNINIGLNSKGLINIGNGATSSQINIGRSNGLNTVKIGQTTFTQNNLSLPNDYTIGGIKTFSDRTKVSTMAETIYAGTLTSNTYLVNYSTLTGGIIMISPYSDNNISLRFSNFPAVANDSTTYNITVLINTSSYKRYCNTLWVNGTDYSSLLISAGGLANITINASSTYVLQTFNIIFNNSSTPSLIITNVASLY